MWAWVTVAGTRELKCMGEPCSHTIHPRTVRGQYSTLISFSVLPYFSTSYLYSEPGMTIAMSERSRFFASAWDGRAP